MFLLLLLPIIIHLAFFFSYLVPVPLLQFSLLTQITEFVYSVSSSLSSLDWFLFWKSLWFIGLICGRVRDAEEQLEVAVELRSERDHSANGLEPVVVAAFPTMKFSSDAFPSSEDGQCSICLGEYEEKEILRIMPSCGHNFHLLCIDTWLQKHSTCPVCRLSLHDSFEAKHVTSPAFIRTNQSGNNSSEVMNDRSNQWLLPARDRSSSSGSSHELHGAAPQNLETRIHIGEVWPVR